MTFNEFKLSEDLIKAIEDAGYTEPTEIQSESIPVILEGHDVIGNSQTGSGKTAAFGLPAIEMIDYDAPKKQVQTLIMCPTRELALQAREELIKFAKYKEGLHVVAIYGGDSIERQIGQLKKGCQIIVGTPGRIMDHMRRKTIKLDKLKTVILDEADEMLNFGFREDIETILEATSENRQTILFSATMPKEILNITNNYQKDPVMLKIKRKTLTVSTIEQMYFDVPKGQKNDALILLLQYYKPELSIVFCNTKKMVDEITGELKKRGYRAEALHGDIKQSTRTMIMNRFKNGGFNVLVATDVAARGIDVNGIDVVFNYDIPQDHEYYVHRIGRTGRAGKDGKSFTFVQDHRQYSELMQIARYTKSEITRTSLPKVMDIKEKNTKTIIDNISLEMSENSINDRQKELKLLTDAGYSDKEIALTLLDMYFKKKESKFAAEDIKKCDYSKDRTRSSFDKRKRNSEKKNFKRDDTAMATVTLSIGRKDRIAPKNILGAVAGESGLPGNIMGAIEISRDYSTIDVPKEHKNKIVKALNKARINNIRIYAK